MNKEASLTVAQLAAIGVKQPTRLTALEIKKVCASALVQCEQDTKPKLNKKALAALDDLVQSMHQEEDKFEIASLNALLDWYDAGAK